MNQNKEPYEKLYDWVVLEYSLSIPDDEAENRLLILCNTIIGKNPGRNPEEYITAMKEYLVMYGFL